MKDFKLRFLLVTGYWVLMTSLVHAYTSLGAFRMGDRISGFSARSLAMGGTAIASDNDSTVLFTNPASLSWGLANRGISVSPGFASQFSRRTHQDNKYAADSKTFFSLQSFSVSFRHPEFKFLTFGAGWNENSNFDFDFEENSSRDRHDQNNSGIADGTDIMKIRGSLAEWVMGFSFKAHEKVSVGVVYNRIAGHLKSETTLITAKTGQSLASQKYEMINDFSGNNFRIGVAGQPFEFLTVGVMFEPRSDIFISSVSSFAQGTKVVADNHALMKTKFPERYGIGALYSFGVSKNVVTADLFYTCRGNVRNDITVMNDAPVTIHSNPNYRNTFDFHLGYEGWIKDKIPFRAGFYNIPDYISSPVSSTPFFTFGTGVQWKKFILDVGGEFGRRTTKQTRLFSSAGYSDELTDTRFRFLTTLSYRWN